MSNKEPKTCIPICRDTQKMETLLYQWLFIQRCVYDAKQEKTNYHYQSHTATKNDTNTYSTSPHNLYTVPQWSSISIHAITMKQKSEINQSTRNPSHCSPYISTMWSCIDSPIGANDAPCPGLSFGDIFEEIIPQREKILGWTVTTLYCHFCCLYCVANVTNICRAFSSIQNGVIC